MHNEQTTKIVTFESRLEIMLVDSWMVWLHFEHTSSVYGEATVR